MDPAACDAAFAGALAELPRWFPRERYTGFICVSWLNDPQLAEYLPAESNIVKFQRRFEVVGPGFPLATPIPVTGTSQMFSAAIC